MGRIPRGFVEQKFDFAMNSQAPSLIHRVAEKSDVPVLAALNRQLIEDEGHRNPMTESQLADRMSRWLCEGGEYRSILFFDKANEKTPVAYALDRPGENEIHLRQFFVVRDRRRQGIGRAATRILRDRIWPRNVRLTVEVLSVNRAAIEFWKSVGFRDYSVCLEIGSLQTEVAGTPS